MASVPAINRGLRVLRLLRDRAPAQLTLTEIARETEIHKATCALVLTELVDQGLLRRTPELRYGLGPELIGLSQAYARGFDPYAHGRREMADFISTTGLSCGMVVRDHDELIVVEMLGNEEPAHLYMRLGRPLPLEPPLGSVFTAWSDQAEIEGWLARMVDTFGGDVAVYQAALATIRARGYSLGSERDFDVQVEAALNRARKAGRDSTVLEVAMIVSANIRNQNAADLDKLPINSIIVPIFDRSGQVCATLDAYGEFDELKSADLGRVVPPLLRAAGRITQHIRGMLPEDFASP